MRRASFESVDFRIAFGERSRAFFKLLMAVFTFLHDTFCVRIAPATTSNLVFPGHQCLFPYSFNSTLKTVKSFRRSFSLFRIFVLRFKSGALQGSCFALWCFLLQGLRFVPLYFPHWAVCFFYSVCAVSSLLFSFSSLIPSCAFEMNNYLLPIYPLFILRTPGTERAHNTDYTPP